MVKFLPTAVLCRVPLRAVTVRAVLQVRIRSGTDQSVVMAARTAGSRRLDQVAVIRGRRKVGDVPGCRVAGGAVCGAGRDTLLQCRHRRVTERAVRTMSDLYRRIDGRAWIMTIGTGRGQGHVTGRHMVDTAVHGQVLVRMAIEAVGRVNGIANGGDHLRPRAVVAGGAGTGAVRGNIVLGAFDLGPGGHHVTVAAGRSRRFKGEIAGSLGNGMRMRCSVDQIKTCRVAGLAVAAEDKVFAHRAALQAAVSRAMAVRAVGQMRRGIDQRVGMTAGTVVRAGRRDQAAVIRSGGVDRAPVAAVTGSTVAASDEVLAVGAVDRNQGTGVGVMAAGTAVMSLGGGADQRVVVTIGTARRWNLHQGRVAGRVGEMNHFPRNTCVWTMAGRRSRHHRPEH